MDSFFKITIIAIFLFRANAEISTSTTASRKEVVSNRAKLSFAGALDPTLVHSHGVKMKWSKVRHVDGYDPSLEDPMQNVNGEFEDEDMKLRPTLTYTLTQRLSDLIFSSLVSKLPENDARSVILSKSNDEIEDLEPFCYVMKPDGVGMEESEENKRHSKNLQKKEEQNESCIIAFSSLQPFYGIAFNFTFTLATTPMDDLTDNQILERTKPDEKGWTKPISNTDAFIQLELLCPNKRSGANKMIGNRSGIPRSMLEVQETNVDEIIEVLLQRANTILGLAYSKVIARPEIEKLKLPLRYKKQVNHVDKNAKINLGTSNESSSSKPNQQTYGNEIIPELLQLCYDQNMKEEECLDVQRRMLDDWNSESVGVSVSTTEETDMVSHKTNNDFMDEMDAMSADVIAADIGDVDGEWDLSMEDLLSLRHDLISLDNLIEEGIENDADGEGI